MSRWKSAENIVSSCAVAKRKAPNPTSLDMLSTSAGVLPLILRICSFIGMPAACRHSSLRSEPDMPLVFAARSSKSKDGSKGMSRRSYSGNIQKVVSEHASDEDMSSQERAYEG